MDLYERLTRADELRKQADELRTAFYSAERRDYKSAEWKWLVELECEADELDGTAERRRREDAARKAEHEARMALYYKYPPEVEAQMKRDRLRQVIKSMDALLQWRHENLDPMHAYNSYIASREKADGPHESTGRLQEDV